MKNDKANDVEFYEKRHEMCMEELQYIRETERLKHMWALEEQRIKSAEIRKAEERRSQREFLSRR